MRPLALSLWAGVGRIAPPFLALLLRRRLRRAREISSRLPERRGIDPTPRPAGKLLWLHAASVGETVSILPVLDALARRQPDITVLMTTGSVTSADLFSARVAAMGIADRVLHRFVPLDVPAWAARFLDHWCPDAAAFVESELWPNLLAACKARKIPLMLVNARLSEKSFRQWRRLPATARAVLGSFTRIQARSQADADRLAALGGENIIAPGDLKFAADLLPVDKVEFLRLQRRLAGRPVWLAANTHPGEEKIMLEAHGLLTKDFPDLLTIIAPRHPQRGAEIAAAACLPVTRRALHQDPPAAGVWIADVLGELGLVYRLTPIAFIGRSLTVRGGQNPLEAARLGCTIAAGPHTDHQIDAFALLEAAGAVQRVSDAASLAAWVAMLLENPAELQRRRKAAVAAVSSWSDLPQQTAVALIGLLGD
jgi:3-deoxy-D-manno-octulosonic-acid transferase